MCAEISVLLVVARPLMRMLLADRLRQESGIVVLNNVETTDQAIEGVRNLTPEIILMDVDFPGCFEATRVILTDHHSIYPVFLADHIRDRSRGKHYLRQ